MKKLITQISALCLLFASVSLNAQLNKIYGKEGLKVYLNEDSTHYIKATGLVQVWTRYNTSNPGSVIYGKSVPNTFDVGLRRVRYQVMAQLSDRVFVYTQFGINNQSSLSARKMQLFLHDATAEYNVHKNWLVLGTGLSAWNGTARYASSSVNSILGMDLPYVQETTNDINDQFVRRMGVFAKGKIGSLDYRFSLTNPLPVQTESTAPGVAITPVLPATAAAKDGVNTAYFSTQTPELNFQGYLMWQFLNKESNQIPYMIGSYLGKKRVLNIGAGFQYQKDAMNYRNSILDSVVRYKPLQQLAVDVFYDYYLNKEKQNAITIYAALLNYNFGPNYIRNAAPMNPATGISSPTAGSFNGSGNGFPLIGTGQVLCAQAAYLFKKDLFGKQGTIQPYVQCVYANYEALKNPVKVLDIGVNWIMSGQNAKLSLDYQSRPIFANRDVNGEIYEIKSARRGQIVLQFQVCF